MAFFKAYLNSESPPQVKKFKYLGVLFMSEGEMEPEIDRRVGAVSAVMRTLHWTVQLGSFKEWMGSPLQCSQTTHERSNTLREVVR